MKTPATRQRALSTEAAAPQTGVLVINLAQATDRMAFQSEQMERLGLDLIRVDAVGKDEIDAATLADFSSRAARPFKPAELACLLSHAKCWDRIIEANKPMLILEDDVVLSERLPEVIDRLALCSETRLVNLETFLNHPKYIFRRPAYTKVAQICDIYKVIKGSAGSAAYLISPRTARRLRTALEKRVAIADTFLGISAGGRYLQTVPALAAQMMTLQACYGVTFGTSGGSSIQQTQAASAGKAERTVQLEQRRTLKSNLLRLRLELRVAAEKTIARFFGQKMTIQPCPDLLSRRA